MIPIKIRILGYMRRFAEKKAKKKLQNNKVLWGLLSDYLKKTGSTGSNWCDYWEIYNYIKKNKPKEVLECGTGVSTIVIAQALKENAEGRVTSMEEIEKYYNMAVELLPEELKNFVEFVHSERVEDNYSIFHGTRYKDIPDRDYEFMYIDGPGTKAKDGTRSFNIDYIYLVRKSKIPIFAIVDKRISACYVFQQVFDAKKVYYNASIHLCFVGPFSKWDLKHFDLKETSSTFSKSFSIFGNSNLKLDFPDFLYNKSDKELSLEDKT